MDIIRLSVFPSGPSTEHLSRHIITTPATRIVKSYRASPWEVFLCPEHAGRVSVHYNRPRRKLQPKGEN